MSYVTIKPSSNSNAPYARLYISSGSQSVTSNYTNVSYKLYLYRPYSISSSSSKSYSITINGSRVKSGSYSISGSGTKTIASGSVKVYHNSDGTKRVSFGASVEFGITFHGSKIGTKSASSSASLPTIPRTSTLTVVDSSINVGENLVFKCDKKSSSFNDYFTFKLGSYTKSLSFTTDTTTETTLTMELGGSEIDKMLLQMPKSSATGTLTMTTKTSGGSIVGSVSKTITVSVPSTTAFLPVIDKAEFSENNQVVKEKFNLGTNKYLQNLSEIKASISATAKTGATISSYSVSINNIKFTESKFENTSLVNALIGANVGTLPVIITATDSRGKVASETVNVNILEYFNPVIAIGSTSYNDQNKQLTIYVSGKIADVEGKNTKNLVINYSGLGISDTSVNITSQLTTNNFTEYGVVLNNMDPPAEKMYKITATLNDSLGKLDVYTYITGNPTMSFLAGGKGISFFQEAENEGLWVGNVDYTLTEEKYNYLTNQGKITIPNSLLEQGSLQFSDGSKLTSGNYIGSRVRLSNPTNLPKPEIDLSNFVFDPEIKGIYTAKEDFIVSDCKDYVTRNDTVSWTDSELLEEKNDSWSVDNYILLIIYSTFGDPPNNRNSVFVSKQKVVDRNTLLPTGEYYIEHPDVYRRSYTIDIEEKDRFQHRLISWIYMYDSNNNYLGVIGHTDSGQYIPYTFTPKIGTTKINIVFTYFDNSQGTSDTSFDITPNSFGDGKIY